MTVHETHKGYTIYYYNDNLTTTTMTVHETVHETHKGYTIYYYYNDNVTTTTMTVQMKRTKVTLSTTMTTIT